MAQLGFFDADKRLETLSAKGDPLEAIDRLVPWESFRAEIEAVVLTPDELKKSSAGRKPFDAMLMFRMLVLQALNNLSDEQVEYQVRDRLSFSRFLGLAIEDSIPDATTLWLFREKLAKAGLIEKLFERFDQHLAAKGYIARGGQIIDASIEQCRRQRAAPLPHRRGRFGMRGLTPPSRVARGPGQPALQAHNSPTPSGMTRPDSSRSRQRHSSAPTVRVEPRGVNQRASRRRRLPAHCAFRAAAPDFHYSMVAHIDARNVGCWILMPGMWAIGSRGSRSIARVNGRVLGPSRPS